MTERIELRIALAETAQSDDPSENITRLTDEIRKTLAARGLRVAAVENATTIWVEGYDPAGNDRPSVQVDYDKDVVYRIACYVEPVDLLVLDVPGPDA